MDFQNGLYHLDDNFSNLVNSLFSCKTTVTHVIRGFLLCQQRGFLSLVTSWTTFLLYFKRSSQSWDNIFRMSKLEYGWLLIILK